MKKFAFAYSSEDMARKLGAAYHHPVDYVDRFVSESYQRSARVDVRISEREILVSGSGSLTSGFFSGMQEKLPLQIRNFIPPTTEFASVQVSSSQKRLDIGPAPNRDIVVSTQDRTVQGWEMTIQRATQCEPSQLQSEESRLINIYKGSDLRITINGEAVGLDPECVTPFHVGSLRGAVTYHPRSRGNLWFYHRGRYLGWRKGVAGINIYYFEHDLPSTITRSGVVTRGKGAAAFKALKRETPRILEELLKSDHIRDLRETSPSSYQTLLRAVEPECSTSYLKETLANDLRYQDSKGRYKEKYTRQYVEDHPRLFKQRNEPVQRSYSIPGLVLLATLAVGFFLSLRSLFLDDAVAKNYLRTQQKTVDITAGSESDEDHLGLHATSMEILKETLGLRDNTYGYVRRDVANSIYQENGEVKWRDEHPSFRLRSDVEVEIPHLLQPLVGTSDHDKLMAVRLYLRNHFEWGILEPHVVAAYPDIIAAIEGEKKALCGNANTYAALILHAMGVDNVRYAVGTKDGRPHAWLEVEDDLEWKRLDCSPSRVDPALRHLMPDPGSLELFLSLIARLGEFGRYTYGGRDESTAESEVVVEEIFEGHAVSELLRESPWLLIGTTAGQFAVILGLFLIARGSWLLLQWQKHRRLQRRAAVADCSQEDVFVLQLQDILGTAVQMTDSENMSCRDGVLLIPRSAADSPSPLPVVAEGIKQLRPDPQHELRIYRNLVRIIR